MVLFCESRRDVVSLRSYSGRIDSQMYRLKEQQVTSRQEFWLWESSRTHNITSNP